MPRLNATLTLSEVIDRMVGAGVGTRVSGDELLAVFGERSYGPMILVPSLLLVSPLSGIPGFSALMAVAIVLISGQMALGRPTPWLPRFLRRRSIARHRLERAAPVLRRVARVADAATHPRLRGVTGAVGGRVIGFACMCIGLVIPPMEIVPMTSSTAGAVVAVFALALTARDGALALVAVGLAAAGVAVGVGILA